MGEDQSPPKQRQVTVAEAADALGISAEAIRSRIKRGTLPTIKRGTTVYVLLDAEQAATEHRQDTDQAPSDATALMSEMRGRIEDLREQLEAEREANRENRRIIAALTSRIPELEAPSTTRDVGSGAPAQPPEDSDLREEPQEGVQRPWWRRMFGG